MDALTPFFENTSKGIIYHIESTKLEIISQIGEYMEKNKLTTIELAEKVGVTCKYLDEFLTEGRHFKFKFLCQLSKVMNCRLSFTPENT